MRYMNLNGSWNCCSPSQSFSLSLPGVLPESCTEEVKITRTVKWLVPKDKRIFLEVEKAKHLSLCVNGCHVPPFERPASRMLHVFEVTNLMTGFDLVEFTVEAPHPEESLSIRGLEGYIRLRIEPSNFIAALKVDVHDGLADVCAVISAQKPTQDVLMINSDAFAAPTECSIAICTGLQEIWLRNLPLCDEIITSSTDTFDSYTLCAYLEESTRCVSFRVRD